MKYDVFLSYRRKGGFETAKHLFDLLTKDGYKVCLDLDTLREGDFNKELLRRIDDCQDFILIVDAHAFDRSVDPDYLPQRDWLRQELSYALKQGKNVIPVLLAGASFPDNLPTDISQVTYKNGPSYSFEYFDSFYEKLKKFLHTKRALIRKMWLFSAIAVVAVIATLWFMLFQGKESCDIPQEYPVTVPQPETVPQHEPLPVDEPVIDNAEVVIPKQETVKTTPIVSSTQSNTVSAGKQDGRSNEKVERTIDAVSEKYIQIVSGRASGYEYVDLGLSVMWATCNVGASRPSDSGQFFAWGELTAKSEYTWATYSFLTEGTNKDNAQFSKYVFDGNSNVTDNLKQLEAADDVAGVSLSGGWRMPTKEEFEELISNCTWKWTKVEGVDGYVVRSRTTGYENNSIFLPAVGYFQKKSVQSKGSRGCYWSASMGTHSYSACYLGFNFSLTRTYNEDRYIGRSVRPVYKKNK